MPLISTVAPGGVLVMASFSADTRVGRIRRSAQRESGWKLMAMTRAEFTTEEAKANGNCKTKTGSELPARFRFGDGFVARAGEDGEAGIFGVGRIGGGALAKEELGAFGGCDGTGVEAVGAEAGVVWAVRIGRGRHVARIALRGLSAKCESKKGAVEAR